METGLWRSSHWQLWKTRNWEHPGPSVSNPFALYVFGNSLNNGYDLSEVNPEKELHTQCVKIAMYLDLKKWTCFN